MLGLDRFSPPLPNGSSHGESRDYPTGDWRRCVCLVLRSYELWHEMEIESDTKLLTIKRQPDS